MIFPSVQEVEILGIWDRGIPNQERIAMRVDERCDLGQFGLIVGHLDDNRGFFPSPHHFLKLGDRIVDPGWNVLVYTGAGQSRETVMLHTNEPAIVHHWGAIQTLFHRPSAAVAIFRIAEISISL